MGLARLLVLCWMLGLWGAALGAQAVAFSDTPNVAIPDNSNSAADSTITVPNTAPYNAHSIGALQVGLRINHTRNQDLDIYLVPPGVVWNRSGANYLLPPPAGVIELSTDNGGNNANYGSGSGPYSYARFSSTADPVYVATQAINAGTVPFTANIYSPEDTADFNARYRTSPVGDWKLVVFDDQNGQTGTLISWELRYVHAYYTDPNLAIPDASRTGATSTITIPANSDRIRTLQVNVRINHNTGNHLDMFLIPPWVTWSGPYTLVNSEFSGGETMNAPFPRGVIELSTDNGGGANFGSGAAVPYTYTRFSAAGDALTPATTAITGGASAFIAAVYLPEGVFDFENCYGRSPSGDWTLAVADDQGGTAGTIVSWQILYTPLEPATLHARLGDNNDPGLPVARGQAGQVLGQFRLDATAATTVTSIVFRESAATNLNGLLTAAALYRDNNGNGLLDGGDTLLATATPAASPNITFNFSQAISAGGGVDLLLTGTVAASPTPVSMQMEIQNAAAIAAAGVTVEGQFPRRAGARPFVSATTFTWRPTLPVLIPDNTDSGITSTITVPATSSRIGSLRVGWRVNGTYDADLDFYLLPPGVTWDPPYSQPNNGPVLSMPPRAIELCTDNGGGGNNFGADLSQHHWTYTKASSTSDPSFAPTTAITAGTAPFTAQTQYTLEGLTAWNMLYAGDPSGTWTLIVVDSWGLDVSYLISWQLEYAPITTPQFWVNAGAENLPGSVATTGQSGQVLGQLALSTFNTAATVTQVILREVNTFNLANNLTAIALYRDNNNDGLFDGGDTLVNAGSMATNVATFNISPTLNVPTDSVVNLLVVATVQATPANTVLELQLLNGADFSGSPAENAPFAVRLGPHPLLEPNTYVSTPTGNINIPDNTAAGITNTITIPATNDLIGALRVGIRIDHARDQDLDIWLIPPGVTWAGPYTTINNGANVTPPAGVIELSTDNGTGANFGSGSVSFVYTVFSRNGDRRFSPGNTPITGGTAPFTAATGYIEEGTTAFNALYGTNPSGNWTIAIGDDQSGSTGRLISWFVQYVPAERAQVNSVPTSGFNDFGNVIVGSPSAAQGFQVQNVGSFSLTLPAPSGTTGIRVTGTHASEFVIQGTAPSGTLAAGASTATFNVVFTPGGTGLRTASITVTWNNSDATMPPTATSNYAIQGTGVQPLIEVRETSIAGPLVANGAAAANGRAFGNQLVGTSSAALTIIVRNTGGTTMTLGTPALGGANPTQFALNLAGFSTSVAAGNSTSFTVTFSPTAAGSFNATVSFTHNATNTASPFSFGVSGTGVQPIVEVRETNAASGALVTNGQAAANGRAFGNVVVGSSSGALTIFVKNTGTSTMTVGTPSLGGANPAQFALNTSGYSTSIAAGSNTSFTVSFNPTAAGAFTATVSLTHDGQNTASPFSFGVSGTGVQPIVEVRETNAVSGALVTNGQAAANGRAFGNVVVGASSGALTIFVKNTGTSAMTVGTPALGGTNPTQFSLNTSGYTTSIAAGSNTSFTVTFSPTATGSFSATVSFTHNGQNTTSPFSFGVSGTGVQPLIEVRETSVAGPLVTNGQAAANGRAFGNHDIAAGPTAALTILVRNTGTSSMTVSVPTLTGADASQFVLNTGGYTTSIAAGANTSFTVAFDPSTPGAKSATVTFTHDGQNTSSPFTFGVSGTGTQPTMTVAASGSPSETGPTPGSFVITASPAPAAARTVNFTMSGTADFAVGVDYNLGGVSSFNGATGQGTVLVGVSGTATITLTPVNDTRVEALETAIITLDPGSDYALGAPSAATLNITDNDTATISLAASGTPGESGATGTYTISTTATLDVTLTINFTMSGVASSSPGVDYNLSATGLSFTGPAGSVTLGPGVAPGKIITLAPVNDTFVEGPETAVMTITGGTQYTGTPNATLTIADNDTATVTVSAAGSPSETGPTSGTFTLTVTPQPRNAMVVNFSLSGSATFGAGFDYTISGATISSAPGGSGPWLGTVNIPGGTGGSVNVNITLTPVNDSIVEGTEDVTLTATADSVSTDPDYSVGSPSSATRNIADNDTATVTVTSSGTPSESGATGSYVIATSATLQYPLTVNFTMSGSATLVLTPGGDFNLSSAGGTYTGPNGTAVLPAGAAPGVTVTLSAVDDSMVEAVETATLTLTGGTLITVGAPASANLSITDNDLATVTVTAAGSPAEAGAVSGTYTIATTATLETPVTVSFLMSGAASTTPGVDYNLSGAGVTFSGPGGSVVLPVGGAPSVIVTLTPLDDSRVENDETATLTVQTAGQAQAGSPAAGTLTILDDDVAVITVTPGGAPSESGATGTFLIATTATLDIALTVNFTTGGAAVAADYNLGGTASFTFPNGAVTLPAGSGSSATVTLTPVNDALVEGPEDASLTVTAGLKYSGTPGATLTILDNDACVITLTTLGSPSESGPTPATFRITATPQPASAMLVNLSLGGSATLGASFDYTVSGTTITGGSGPWTATVTIPGGGAGSVSVDIVISPVDDSRVEGTETVTLDVTADTVSTDPDYTGTPSASLNLADNDFAQVSVTSAGSAAEPATTATFIIQNAGTLDVPVTVSFTLSGSAQSGVGADYTLSGTGVSHAGLTAVLPVGTNTQVVVTLTPFNDTIVEATESAILTVLTAGLVNAVSPVSATVNIADDDTATVNVSRAGSPSETGPTSGTYTLSTTATLEIALTVNFTMSGAASTTPGVDYNLTGIGVTFSGPGGSAILPVGAAPNVVITLAPIDDVLVEGDETATLTISGGGQVVVGTASQTHTIADNDVPVVTITSSGSPAEGGGGGSFTVATTATLAVPLVVNFTMSGLASTASGEDYTLSGFTSYTAPTGTVTLPAGVAPGVNVTFTVVNDTFVEGPESVIMTLNSGGGYSVGAPNSATLTIADNDTATVTVSAAGSPSETGPTSGTFTLTVTPQPRNAMVVNFSLSGSATFGAGFDYTISGATISSAPGGSGPWLGTVNIPGGTGGSVNVNITLTPVNDSIVEGTEDVTLTATADSVSTDPDYSVGSPSSATRNIADNDTATVTVTSSGTPSESGATGSYLIATSATLQYPLTVNFTMSGSATLVLTPSGDFNLSSAGGTYTGPNGTAVLPAGAAPGVTVTLSAVDDSMVEAAETATLTLTGGTLITVGAPASANLSILDNDLATVTVTAAGSPAEAGTVSGTYTIATTATLEVTLTVNFTMGGLADVNTGVDYTLSGAASYTAGTGTATLAAGVAPSVIITLTPVDDAAVEGPEDAALALQTGAQYTLGAPSSASLTIADNDVTVIAVAASGSPNESGPINGTFTITATPAPQHNMTVNFAMSGTADFGGANPDYTLSGAAAFSTVTGLGTVVIGPSGVAVITLHTIDDALAEPTETATLTLNADSVTTDPDYSVGSPSADTLSILDNDLPIITVMGGPLNFGGVEIGAASTAQTYTVSGVFLTADIVVSAPAAFEVALAAGGPWGSSLNLTPVSGSVPTTTIFVRFAPASLGAASGNVSNASTGATTQDVAVSGTGTGITVSAASLAFGTLYVGTTSAAQSYTLAAEGLSNDLLVSAPAGFELSTTGGAPWLASLNLGSGSIAATTIFVRFAPATVGAFSGNVSNASAGFTPRDVSVSGTGVAGVLGISGTQNHGNVPVTQSGAAILYTISNSATGPFAASLTVNSVTLGGANPGDFALSSFSTSLPATLAPSQSFTFLATFTPLAQGVRNANVVINSNSGSEPPANTNYAIFGTGTPGLFAAPPTFPTGVDTGGPVVVQCVISAVSNTTADVAIEYIGGTQTSWTPAIIARTNAGTISGNVIVGVGVLAAGSTLEIYWDAYASERHITATNYQIRFTPSNGIYGTGTTGTSVALTLSRNAGWATHDVPTDQLTGRFGHAAVYDAANDRMIVFGGKINGWVTNDVWAYDRGAYNAGWHRLSPTGSLPPARQYGVAVYDAANQRMILFGGWNSIARMNDVWALSLVRGSETWTQLTPAGTPPAGRYYHNFVLDAARSRAVVFGGNGASGMLNDVWTLSLGLGSETWTQLAPSGTPPTPRCGANAVVDAPRDRLVVHGGDIGGGSAQSQVFALSLSPGTETWSALTPAGTAPSPRYLSTVEYAPNRQAMLVSSGYTTGARVTADSFLLDFNGGDVWTPLPADPAANVGRLHGTAVYDAARAELILFGGYNGNAYIQSSLSFLKVLPTPSFTVPAAAGAPTPAARYGVSTVYDTRYGANGRVVMFGGMSPSNRFNDVWWMDPTAANPAWTRMNPTGTPPAARAYAAAVYDGRTGMERMIVFGGQSASGYLNDVWALDLSNPGSESWTQLSASGGPSARIQSAVALDLTFGSERLLMFAGRTTGGNTNDVWQFSLVTLSWTPLNVLSGGSPPVRSNHNVSYDAATNRLVAFLGTGNAGRLADTWAFDLTAGTWANLTPGSGTPSVREGAAGAAVAAGNRVFVHGGYDGGWLTDLWQLDIPAGGPVTWTPLAPANAPVGRNNHGACLSPSGKFYVACGNLGISLNPGSSDIWELDTSSPVAWQQLGQAGAPTALVHSAEAYDSLNRRMFAFGGLVNGTLDNNLWMLDLASPIAAWTAVTPASSVRPAPRRNSKMIFDPLNNRLIVYGGFLARATSSITNELWQFDLGSNTWSQLFVAGGPLGLSSPSMIYDPVTAGAVLFGGQTATSHINEVWRLSLGATPSWTLLASGGPAARKGHSAIYDALQHRMIIFGGHNGSSSFSDLWSFNLATNTWTQHGVAGGPSARHYHTAVYDSTPGLERMILVGGFVGNTLAGGEIMQLDLRSGFPMAWSNMPITVARPQPRWGHISVFDEVGRRTVVCGGYTDGEIAIVNEGGIPDTWFYGR